MRMIANDNKPETMSIEDTVKYIMKTMGWSKKKAERELLKKLQSGEVRAYGIPTNQ